MLSPYRRAAATLAAVVSLAVAAPVGPVAETSPAGCRACSGRAGATLSSARVAPHPVAPTVASYQVRGVSKSGLAALGRSPSSGRPAALAALSPPEPASGFAVTGVTWRGGRPRV